MASIRPFAAVQAWVEQKVQVHDSSDKVASPGEAAPPLDLERDASGGMEDRIPMGEEISTSSPSASAALSTSGQGQRIQSSWVHVLAQQLPAEKIIGGMGAAISAVKSHIGGMCRMLEVSTQQYEDSRKHRKRLYEFTKKAATFEAVLLFALCNQQPYSRNTAFKVALAMLLLAFFINILTSVLLLNFFNFPFKYLIYTSSIIQILMPFALLVSSGQLQPYTILISLLPFFSIALFNRAVTDDSELDHIFDLSAGVYALLSAGCALASPYFISKESVAASPLACSLFLTILIARYLMLISTMRPPVIVQDAKTLMFILKLLVAWTVIFLAVEFLGWQLALVVISVGAIDAVLFSKNLLAHSPGTTRGDNEPSDQIQRKDQQLLSAVLVGILFMALTQAYSEHVAAHEASLGSAAMLRMLLYLGAFLWSLNRMIITLGDAAAPLEGEHTAVSVWCVLEWARASVVVAAVLDMIWKFGIAFIMGSK